MPVPTLLHTSIHKAFRVEYRAAVRQGLVELEITANWGPGWPTEQIGDRVDPDRLILLLDQLRAKCYEAKKQKEIEDGQHEKP